MAATASKCIQINSPKNVAFVAVHVGAGFHSVQKTGAYRILCDDVCTEIMGMLNNGCDARKAAAHAVQLLEVNIELFLILFSCLVTFSRIFEILEYYPFSKKIQKTKFHEKFNETTVGVQSR